MEFGSGNSRVSLTNPIGLVVVFEAYGLREKSLCLVLSIDNVWGLKFHKVVCYNLKLGSDCNSGKDLSKNKGYDQLVKYKDTKRYLHYIYL